MSNIPTGGQMLWKLEDGERVLHLRHNAAEQWRHYEDFLKVLLLLSHYLKKIGLPLSPK